MFRDAVYRGAGLVAGAALMLGAAGNAVAENDATEIDKRLGPVETDMDLDLPPELSLLEDFIELVNLEERVPDVPDDIDKVAELQDTLQSNALTNGEITEYVTDLLQKVSLEDATDIIRSGLPGSEPLLDSTGLSDLIGDTQQGIDTLALLIDVATFRFVTESNGIERSHTGVLNTPMKLDVDDRVGPDVIATLSFEQGNDGSLGLQLEVERHEQPVRGLLGGLLGGLTGGLLGGGGGSDGEQEPLPLDIRAVVDVPVAALTGGSAAPLQIELGFDSETGIPENSQLDASIADVAGGDDAEASIVLTTDEPTDDFSLVGRVSEENAETLAFDPIIDFSVALAPAPESLSLDALLGDNLNVALTTSAPTTPTIAFDVADEAAGELVISQLPPAMNIFVGEDEGNQIVSYTADEPIDELLAELSIADGFDIDAALRELPPAADLDFGDGTGIDIDLGGAQIGEIAFTLTDGPDPRNVGEDLNGAVLDLREGLMVGARFEGFQGLAFGTEPSLGLEAQIDTPQPVVFDVELEDGSFADIEFSGFPDDLSLALDDSGLFDVQYTASASVDQVAISTNTGVPGLTANIAPMPESLSLCAAQDDNSCTGATDGNVVDASLDASQPITVDAFICLAGDCNAPDQSFQLAPLTFERLDISGNTGESCINIPFVGEECLGNGSAGQFFIHTDGSDVEGTIDADLGDTQVFVDGGFSAQNRMLDYSALDAQFDRSGTMNCDGLTLDVITGGTNIGDFIDPADLLCSN